MKKQAIISLSMVFIATSLTACQSKPTVSTPTEGIVPMESVVADDRAGDFLRQGIVFANQNDFINAVGSFKQSLSIAPSPDAYANLGASYMQLGKRNLAMMELKKAEAMDPNHSLTLYNMTALQSLNDNTDIALEYFDRTLSSGFDNYDAIRFDPDLQNLRGEPEFRSILEKHKVFIQ